MWARRNSMPMSAPYDPSLSGNVGSKLQARDESNGAAIPSRVMITATTYMTMMIYETQRPVTTAGRVGADPVPAVAASPTGTDTILDQPSATAVTNPTKQPTNSTSPLSSNRKPGTYLLSEGTEHVLIAAGAIGATILLVFIIYSFYRLRQGTPVREIFKSLKKRQDRLSPKSKRKPEKGPFVSAPLGNNWGAYKLDKKNLWDAETSFAGSSVQYTPLRPNPAFVRPGTSSSNQSLLMGLKAPSVAPFPPPNRRSLSAPPNLPLQPNPPARNSRLPYVTPSSGFLPNERPTSRSERKPSNTSSIPPYLSDFVDGSPVSAPKLSRFSWTNSQAPKTPMDTRFSVASSANSAPRYRTVESWVGQQAGRFEDQKIEDQLKQQIEEAIQEVNEASGVASNMRTNSPQMMPQPRRESEDTVPTLPDMPTQFTLSAVRPFAESSLPAPFGLPETMREHREEDSKHRTQGSDAPIFRAHPGTEVRIPRGSFIPSEILDGKMAPNAF